MSRTHRSRTRCSNEAGTRTPWFYDPGDVIDYPWAMRVMEEVGRRRKLDEFAHLEIPLPMEVLRVVGAIRRGELR